MKSLKKSKGFTLLEMLVAFTLLAITFGTIMQIIGGSTKNTMKAAHNTKIAMLSQSKMDELGLHEKIEEGSTNGDFDDTTSWEMIIEEYEVPSEGDNSQDVVAIELMEITLTVSTEVGRRVKVDQFKTLRAITPDYSKGR